MALPNSLILASEVIGFISFAITLLTLVGVYADLIKTLRGAPTTIPIILGNLREEIRYEQLLCKEKLSEGDAFHVFPGRKPRKKSRHEYSRLLSHTLKHLWVEFCDLEKRFLITGEKAWNDPDSDDDGDRMEPDEKGTRRRRNNRPKMDVRQSYIRSRMGWIEAGLSRDRSTYYSTDLAHRFLWWWKREDINHLADQVQRIQIRRIERDTFETNELVKRGLKYYGRDFKVDVYHSSDDDTDRGGGGSGSDDGGGPKGTHVQHRRHSGVAASRTSHRRRSTNGNAARSGGFREVSEKEVIRRRASSPENSTPTRPPPRMASRRERPPRGSVVYEYEVVDPGRIHVEYESPRQDQRWREGRQRSYSRDRSPG